MKENNNNLKETSIEILILKNFMAVLKKYNKYTLFRCVVGANTDNIVSNIYKNMYSFNSLIRLQRSRDDVFVNASDMNSFANILKDVQHGGISQENSDPKTIQKYVANCINLLLHIYIERQVRDIKAIEEIGGQIFDMTCKELLGNDFEDLLVPPSEENVAKMRELNQFLMECNDNGRTLPQDRLDEIRAFIDSIRRDGGNEDMWYAQPNLGNEPDEPVEEDYDDYFVDDPW